MTEYLEGKEISAFRRTKDYIVDLVIVAAEVVWHSFLIYFWFYFSEVLRLALILVLNCLAFYLFIKIVF